LRAYLYRFLIFLLIPASTAAQINLSGTVYDISKVNYVENVRVVCTNGLFTVTDSMGRYQIQVHEHDSVSFIYQNKPTQKFAVASISDSRHFDISLRIPVKGKYSMLKEVTVYAKTYKMDSLENRTAYADIYEYRKPGIQSSVSPDGAAGMDLGALVDMFRFKRNKRMQAFQRRLEQEEQEKYVNYRFSKIYVKRITGLTSPALDSFLLWYRPDYNFTRSSDELRFNEYILKAYYHFVKLNPQLARKPDE
jgi:hypothetical protein